MKDLAEAESKRLGIKADHIFGQKGLDASESLKTFLEEHPDIIFDFVVVGVRDRVREHGSARRGDQRPRTGPAGDCDADQVLSERRDAALICIIAVLKWGCSERP